MKSRYKLALSILLSIIFLSLSFAVTAKGQPKPVLAASVPPSQACCRAGIQQNFCTPNTGNEWEYFSTQAECDTWAQTLNTYGYLCNPGEGGVNGNCVEDGDRIRCRGGISQEIVNQSACGGQPPAQPTQPPPPALPTQPPATARFRCATFGAACVRDDVNGTFTDGAACNAHCFSLGQPTPTPPMVIPTPIPTPTPLPPPPNLPVPTPFPPQFPNCPPGLIPVFSGLNVICLPPPQPQQQVQNCPFPLVPVVSGGSVVCLQPAREQPQVQQQQQQVAQGGNASANASTGPITITLAREAQQRQVVQAAVPVAQLPKTGLPEVAWGVLSGLVPAGLGLRKFKSLHPKGSISRYLWEKRQFLKNE